MAEHQLIAILSLAFGLGLLHALDADHIMAVSGLASRQPSFKKSLMFCLRWAIGHASALLIIGSAVFFVGAAIPDRLSHFAEQAVGVMLLLLGSWIIYDLRLRNLRLHSHQHQGLPRHIHWHSPQLNHSSSDKSDHSAVLVGILHGVAGSAPLLAIIPLSKLGSVWYGFAYLVLFGLGVFVSMVVFGGLLGGAYQYIMQWSNRAFCMLKMGIGLSSLFYGGYILHNT